MNIPAWRYYSRFYKGSYRMLALSIGISIGLSLIVLPIAYLVRYVFDEVIPAGDIRLLVLAGVAVFVLSLVNSGLTLWTQYVTLKITKGAIQRFRDELLKRVFTSSFVCLFQIVRLIESSSDPASQGQTSSPC